MIKYGIFIQGGESMKKIISLVLATLLCAAVFAGCGSGENDQNSEASQSIPSHVGISLNADINTIKESIDLEVYDDGYDDGDRKTYVNQEGTTCKIGNTEFDSAMFFFDKNMLDGISYFKIADSKQELEDDFAQLKKDLTEIYGQPKEISDGYYWSIELPDDNEFVFEIDLKIEKQEGASTYYSLDVDIDRIDKELLENFEKIADGFEKFKDGVYSE